MEINLDIDDTSLIFKKILEKLYLLGIDCRIRRNFNKNEDSPREEKDLININLLEKKINNLENKLILFEDNNTNIFDILLDHYAKVYYIIENQGYGVLF